jgi:hypothetical protein
MEGRWRAAMTPTAVPGESKVVRGEGLGDQAAAGGRASRGRRWQRALRWVEWVPEDSRVPGLQAGEVRAKPDRTARDLTRDVDRFPGLGIDQVS